MFEIILQRLNEYKDIKLEGRKPEDCTTSSFKVFKLGDKREEILSLFCVENGGESTDEEGRDKRIMPRTYKLYWTPSSVALPHGYKNAISLYTDELASFKKRRIHIHIGNYPQNTEGCLLLNSEILDNGIGKGSGLACRKFYDLVKREGIENFTLSIREIEG